MIRLLESDVVSPRFTVAKDEKLERKYPGITVSDDWCRFAEITIKGEPIILVTTAFSTETLDDEGSQISYPVEYDKEGYRVHKYLNVFSRMRFDDQFEVNAQYRLSSPSQFSKKGQEVVDALSNIRGDLTFNKYIDALGTVPGAMNIWS